MRVGESRDNMLPFSSLHHHDVIIPRSCILHLECHMRTGESRDNVALFVITSSRRNHSKELYTPFPVSHESG